MREIEIVKPTVPASRKPESDMECAHRLELKIDKEVVGYAEFHYHNGSFPVYYISFVFTRHRYRGEGWGNEIIQNINKFLSSSGKSGLLFDVIESTNPAKGLYQKNGWLPIPGKPFWYGFHLPPNLNNKQLDRAIYKIDKAEKKRADFEKLPPEEAIAA